MNKSLFFCTGLPKSGTTFLQRTLNLHAEIYCPSEHSFSALAKNLSVLLDQYQGLLELIDARTGGQGVMPFSGEVKNKIFRCTVEQLIIENTADKKIVGANDNAIVNNLEFYSDLFDQPRLIVIFRHPVDAAISAWHHNSRLAEEEKNPQHIEIMTRHGGFEGWLKFYAQLFEKTVQGYKNFSSKNPQVIHLRYEDLKNNKSQTLQRLFEFLGVAANNSLIDDVVKKSSLDAMAESSKYKAFFRAGSTSMGEGVVSGELKLEVEKISAGALEHLGYI